MRRKSGWPVSEVWVWGEITVYSKDAFGDRTVSAGAAEVDGVVRIKSNRLFSAAGMFPLCSRYAKTRASSLTNAEIECILFQVKDKENRMRKYRFIKKSRRWKARLTSLNHLTPARRFVISIGPVRWKFPRRTARSNAVNPFRKIMGLLW